MRTTHHGHFARATAFYVDTNIQKIVVVIPMITHLKQAGAERTEIFSVGGNSVVAQGRIDEVFRRLCP